MTTGVWVLMALSATPWMSRPEVERSTAIREAKSRPVSERVAALSGGFLGTPYQLSPLGEGEGRDPDPLLRYDAVDCVTMVEQTMAMALARDDAGVLEALNRIRYEGAPSWSARRHITEVQWVPQLIKAGLLKDVTRALGGEATRTEAKVLTKKTWAEKSGRSLALPEGARPLGKFDLDVIPADVAVEKLKAAKSGTIVVVARADRPWLITRVTHMGILIQGPNGPAMRHASRSFKRVVDEPLEKYLKRNIEFGAWTVVGVSLFEVVE